MLSLIASRSLWRNLQDDAIYSEIRAAAPSSGRTGGSSLSGAGRGSGGYVATRRTGAAQAEEPGNSIDTILDGAGSTFGRW